MPIASDFDDACCGRGSLARKAYRPEPTSKTAMPPSDFDGVTPAKVQCLLPIAEELHLSMSQLALAWVLRRAEVTSCIIGATKPQQVEQNAEASGIKLDDSVVQRMNDVLA